MKTYVYLLFMIIIVMVMIVTITIDQILEEERQKKNKHLQHQDLLINNQYQVIQKEKSKTRRNSYIEQVLEDNKKSKFNQPCLI